MKKTASKKGRKQPSNRWERPGARCKTAQKEGERPIRRQRKRRRNGRKSEWKHEGNQGVDIKEFKTTFKEPCQGTGPKETIRLTKESIQGSHCEKRRRRRDSKMKENDKEEKRRQAEKREDV